MEVYPRLTENTHKSGLTWALFFHFLRNLFWSQPPGYHLSSTSEERLELRGGLPGWHSVIRISREKGTSGSCLYLCYFGFLSHQRRGVILAVNLTSWDYGEVQKKKKKSDISKMFTNCPTEQGSLSEHKVSDGITSHKSCHLLGIIETLLPKSHC